MVSPTKSEVQKPNMRQMRTRLSGVDDIMRDYQDPTEVLFRCDEISDFAFKTKKLQTSLRRECRKEIDNVASCLVRIEEEKHARELRKSQQSVINRKVI